MTVPYDGFHKARFTHLGLGRWNVLLSVCNDDPSGTGAGCTCRGFAITDTVWQEFLACGRRPLETFRAPTD